MLLDLESVCLSNNLHWPREKGADVTITVVEQLQKRPRDKVKRNAHTCTHTCTNLVIEIPQHSAKHFFTFFFGKILVQILFLGVCFIIGKRGSSYMNICWVYIP